MKLNILQVIFLIKSLWNVIIIEDTSRQVMGGKDGIVGVGAKKHEIYKNAQS